MAIQTMQMQLQLQQELKKDLVRLNVSNHLGSNHSGSFTSFDMSRTGTFAVPTKMYQDEVPQERQGRPKKRLSLGSPSDKFDHPFGMNQVYASTGNITNCKSLASTVTAESTGGGGFKNNDQFPTFSGMNCTASAVTSTATNFTPSSADSLMTLYKPLRQKQAWTGEEQPYQNVDDCCDSDGKDDSDGDDSIDALFKDFKGIDPLDGGSFLSQN
jgi:hypothetical protein